MKEQFEIKLEEARKNGYTIGACIRVEWNNTFLLLRRSPTDTGAGLYENPGGGVDEGETLEEAATREVFEEAGISIPIERLIPLHIFEFHNVETGKHKVKFAFSTTLDSEPTLKLSADHDDFKFLSREEIEVLGRQGRDEPYVLWEDHYKVLSI
jgi:8-oxo-dGTP pyrophosphatase MutT (NUDIX family)